jgi:hypothetical protein
MQNANASTYHFSVGNAVATALHDCWFEVNSGDVVAGISSEEATRQQQERFRPPPGRIDLTAFLIELDGQHILVDAGIGLVDAGIGDHVKSSFGNLATTTRGKPLGAAVYQLRGLRWAITWHGPGSAASPSGAMASALRRSRCNWCCKKAYCFSLDRDDIGHEFVVSARRLCCQRIAIHS